LETLLSYSQIIRINLSNNNKYRLSITKIITLLILKKIFIIKTIRILIIVSTIIARMIKIKTLFIS
jgi:hypothetical protein